MKITHTMNRFYVRLILAGSLMAGFGQITYAKSFKIYVSQAAKQPLELTISNDETLGDVRRQISGMTHINPDTMAFAKEGKVMFPTNNDTVEMLGIQPESTLMLLEVVKMHADDHH